MATKVRFYRLYFVRGFKVVCLFHFALKTTRACFLAAGRANIPLWRVLLVLHVLFQHVYIGLNVLMTERVEVLTLVF